MSDDTQHAPPESVHANTTSAVPVTTITITIDNGDTLKTATIRVPKDHFTLRPVPHYPPTQNWAHTVRPTRVDFEFNAYDLVQDEGGHYLNWTHNE